MEVMVGQRADFEAAQAAFESTPGDFGAKFTAAVQARFAGMLAPEQFIDIPEDPERLSRAGLEALVRPVAAGFLRSNPSKGDLLDQIDGIKYRQQSRPAWMPRVDGKGVPLAPAATVVAEDGNEPDRPFVISALPELGDVTIMLPCAGEEEARAELSMATGGIGEWESALFALLGLAGTRAPAATITLDVTANQALVPESSRWWAVEPLRPVPASQDPGVASELLATSPTLGAVPVVEAGAQTFAMMASALASSGDWRYSSRWQLESWEPGDDTTILTIARAAIAGWADESLSGVIVYVFGGALRAEEGQIGIPSPLHSYLLAATRAATGTDAVEAVHRVVLSCPGEYWCHRGGCAESEFPAAATLLAQIAASADTIGTAAGIGGSSADSYQLMYGDEGVSEFVDDVLEHLASILQKAGWSDLGKSEWDGGMDSLLLRRGEHCLEVAYDPVTRQAQLIDGKPELESMLDLLHDDGVFAEEDGQETIDFSQGEKEGWRKATLTAVDDLLHGGIEEMPHLDKPFRATILGLHPHADGTLRAPEAVTLAVHQLNVLLRTAGVL